MRDAPQNWSYLFFVTSKLVKIGSEKAGKISFKITGSYGTPIQESFIARTFPDQWKKIVLRVLDIELTFQNLLRLSKNIQICRRYCSFKFGEVSVFTDS